MKHMNTLFDFDAFENGDLVSVAPAKRLKKCKPSSQKSSERKKNTRRKKKKVKRRRSASPVPRDLHQISWKLRRVIEYQNLPPWKHNAWLEKRAIDRRDINRWIEKKQEWIKMTKRQRWARTRGRRKNYGKGDFPEAEAIVYEQFLQWRKMKYQVPLFWFSKRMKRVMKQRAEAGLQPGYDPKTQQMAGINKKYTFGKSWAIRFKKRNKIKRRRRTNKKNSSLWKRRPKIQKNLRFLIYRLQNPELMAKKYMTLSAIIKKREVEEDCEDNILPEDRTDESDEEDETSSESED